MIKRYKSTEINELVDILKRDGVISIPTDTVYGICARMDSKEARDKLIMVKNRPALKSFPIMCATIDQIKSISIVNKTAEKLIEKLMPVPITTVLKKNRDLPEFVTNGKDTIAVRLATSKTIEDLILKLGSPIFMTSANQNGAAECTNLDEIEESCPLLDGMVEGDVIFSRGSTIVDCSGEDIKILRDGPISLEKINSIIENKYK